MLIEKDHSFYGEDVKINLYLTQTEIEKLIVGRENLSTICWANKDELDERYVFDIFPLLDDIIKEATKDIR